MQKLSLAFFWWQFSFHFIYVLNRVYLTMITSLCWGTLVPRGEMHAVNNTAPAAIFSTHLLKYYNRLNLIMAHTMAKNNKSLTITNNYTVAIANIPCDISSIVCFFARHHAKNTWLLHKSLCLLPHYLFSVWLLLSPI